MSDESYDGLHDESGWKAYTRYNPNKCYNCGCNWYTVLEDTLPGFLCRCPQKDTWKANLGKVRALLSDLRDEESKLLKWIEAEKK